MLSNLRKSGAIEQDPDVVIFLYRNECYNPDTEEKEMAEVNIARQRNGPIGSVKLPWFHNPPVIVRKISQINLCQITVEGSSALVSD